MGKYEYRNVPKFSDRQVWANSVDPDLGLHCFPFHLLLLDAFITVKSLWSNFRVISAIISSVRIFRIFTVICTRRLYDNFENTHIHPPNTHISRINIDIKIGH